jgi:hypothetical protein
MKKYLIKTIDDAIDNDLRDQVWNYILNQKYHATRKNLGYPNVGKVIHYIPAENKKEYLTQEYPCYNNQYMHRTVFGDNEIELQNNHPIIFQLWNKINEVLGNQFIIAGDKEGIADNGNGKPILSRVYVNAQPDEEIKRSHGVHRDTIDLNEEKNFTLLYIANPEWYPTWMAENVFYSDDETGDIQQWQKGFGQSRKFNVGWPSEIVSPKAGRIILYDGRTLHTTKPTSSWAEQMRYAVVFRIRKKD